MPTFEVEMPIVITVYNCPTDADAEYLAEELFDSQIHGLEKGDAEVTSMYTVRRIDEVESGLDE